MEFWELDFNRLIKLPDGGKMQMHRWEFRMY